VILPGKHHAPTDKCSNKKRRTNPISWGKGAKFEFTYAGKQKTNKNTTGRNTVKVSAQDHQGRNIWGGGGGGGRSRIYTAGSKRALNSTLIAEGKGKTTSRNVQKNKGRWGLISISHRTTNRDRYNLYPADGGGGWGGGEGWCEEQERSQLGNQLTGFSWSHYHHKKDTVRPGLTKKHSERKNDLIANSDRKRHELQTKSFTNLGGGVGPTKKTMVQ